MKRYFFVCLCNNIEHQFCFVCDDEDVYLEVHLANAPLWKRIINGIKYIFGHRSKYGDFDCVLLQKEDADKLQAVVEHLKHN